jgi:hypothetical protein
VCLYPHLALVFQHLAVVQDAHVDMVGVAVIVVVVDTDHLVVVVPVVRVDGAVAIEVAGDVACVAFC